MKIEILRQTISFDDLASKLVDCVTEVHVEDASLVGGNDAAFGLNKAIRGHPSLKKVTFVNVTSRDAANGVDGIASTLLVSVPNITSFRFEKTKISPSSMSSVLYNSSLEDVVLSHSGYTDDEVMAMAPALAKCPTLLSLDLRGNPLTDAGRMAIASILKKSTTLHQVLLEDASGSEAMDLPGGNPAAKVDCCVPRAA